MEDKALSEWGSDASEEMWQHLFGPDDETTVTPAAPGAQQPDAADADSCDEEVIGMEDPRFAALSLRRQKLMALNQVLQQLGIEA